VRVIVTMCLLILLAAGASTAVAQPPPPPPPREFAAELSFVGTSGNASTTALGIGAEYIVREAPWTLTSRTAFVRNETEGLLQAKALVARFRAARAITERLSAFGQYGYVRDLFAGVEHRNMIDAGVQYALVRTELHELDVDAGFGYANEQRSTGDDLSAAQALAGAMYKLRISETADISDEARFSASLDAGEDWRFANNAALTAKLTTAFSLKLSNVVRYVNDPATGFEKTDSLTSVALVVKF
jgi:putative salt-induced outer membrane protein